MSFAARLLLCLCVFAGMATGMVHKTSHASDDECAHAHSHDHGSQHDHSAPDDTGENEKAPHHHDCCHSPSADRPSIAADLPSSFQTRLVEISTDRSPLPDEPLYALEKPPLI